MAPLKTDPYAPPKKVRDENTALKLEQVLDVLGRHDSTLADMVRAIEGLVSAVANLGRDDGPDPELLAILARVTEAMATPPQVVVPAQVPPPPVDLTPLMTAIEGSKLDLDAVVEALKKVQPRVTSGGSSTRRVSLLGDGGVINPATEGTLQSLVGALTGVGAPDTETRLDYDVRTDGNPVYVGVAPQGSVTSGAVWTVQKLTYDGSDRLTNKEQLQDAVWDDRATLGWN